ncbi:MAG: ribonuclease HII [Desulfobulbaceae bacterium A2]|nr:MAG: ribonuclease HII [Desulfobulbaceae bacterium A2]
MPGTDCAGDSFFWERELARRGYLGITGVDEAGRGPLAGPVVAAAVILPADCDYQHYRDSKKLTAPQRERLLEKLRTSNARIGVGQASPAEIDRDNILRASLLAMRRAVQQLAENSDLPSPDFLLVDGTFPVSLSLQQRTLVRGETASASIAAASIVAKVTRDRLLDELDQQYPAYQFCRHKGYPTALHRDLLRRLGPCPEHRRSFRGVRELLHDETAVAA